jgi:hypothetical protein
MSYARLIVQLYIRTSSRKALRKVTSVLVFELETKCTVREYHFRSRQPRHKALSMSMAKRPFTYCKVKATSFGKEWAQEEYGRGYTTKYMYGKYTGPGKNAKHITAVWDDSTTCQAQLSKCEAVTMAEFNHACDETKARRAGEPFLSLSLWFPLVMCFTFLACVLQRRRRPKATQENSTLQPRMRREARCAPSPCPPLEIYIYVLHIYIYIIMTNNGTRMRMLHSAGKGAKRQTATGAGAGARKKTKRGALYPNCSTLRRPIDYGATVTVKVGSVFRTYPRHYIKPWGPFQLTDPRYPSNKQ